MKQRYEHTMKKAVIDAADVGEMISKMENDGWEIASVIGLSVIAVFFWKRPVEEK